MRIWPRVWHHIREGTEKQKREQLDSEESGGAKVELMCSNNVYGCLPRLYHWKRPDFCRRMVSTDSGSLHTTKQAVDFTNLEHRSLICLGLLAMRYFLGYGLSCEPGKRT